MPFQVTDVSQIQRGMLVTIVERSPDTTGFAVGQTTVVLEGAGYENLTGIPGNPLTQTIRVSRIANNPDIANEGRGYFLQTTGFGRMWTVTSETELPPIAHVPMDLREGMTISIDTENIDATGYAVGRTATIDNISDRTMTVTSGGGQMTLFLTGLNRGWHVISRLPLTPEELGSRFYKEKVGDSVLSLSRSVR